MSVKNIVNQVNLPKGTKDILSIVQSFLRYLLIFSFVPILFAAGLGYYFFIKESSKPDIYSAKISFIETDKISTSSSGLGSVQFPGIQFNSGRNDVASSLVGILESDKILSEALFKDVSKTSQEKLVNLYFRLYFPDEYNDIKVTNFHLDSLTKKQISFYNAIKSNIYGENATPLTYDEQNVLHLIIPTPNEELSFSLVNNLYEALSDFFDDAANNTFDETLAEMENARDSTHNVLKRYERQLAQKRTSEGFEVLPVQNLPNTDLVEKIALTKQQYYTLYAEVDAYKIRNKVGQKIFTKLSSPLLPLPVESPSAISKAIIGGVIGFVLGLFLLVTIYILRIAITLYKKIDEEN